MALRIVWLGIHPGGKGKGEVGRTRHPYLPEGCGSWVLMSPGYPSRVGTSGLSAAFFLSASFTSSIRFGRAWVGAHRDGGDQRAVRTSTRCNISALHAPHSGDLSQAWARCRRPSVGRAHLPEGQGGRCQREELGGK